MFFVAPRFQSHDSFRSIKFLDDRSGAMPSALLIESRRAVIANRACEPRALAASCGKAGLGVGNQRRSNTRAPRSRRHKELIQLVALEHRESDGRTNRPHHAGFPQRGLPTAPETRPRPTP